MSRMDDKETLTEGQKNILETFLGDLRYKVVDTEGNIKSHHAQWPHDFALPKGWKIIDKQE